MHCDKIRSGNASTLAVLALLQACSCEGSTHTAGDAVGDPGREALDTADDERTDAVDSMPVDVPADETVDPVTEDPVPPPRPITFIVANVSAGSVYLDWSMGATGAISGSRTTGGAWYPVHYWPPGCMENCENVEPGGECCVMCDMVSSVKELGGGEEARVQWDGEVLFTVVEDYCTCSCYRPEPVPAMAYRAQVCVHDSYECLVASCEADENGVYELAAVSGTPRCFEALFDIPYAGDEVLIEVH